MEGNIEPRAIHRKKLKEIYDTTPKDYLAWLKTVLGFTNRKTLAMRLKEITDIYPEVVKARSGNQTRFIKNVKDTRNYYTHYDPSLEGKAAMGGRLRGLSVTLGLLLEGILLHEIGFEITRVKEIQKNRKRLPTAWY